MRPQRPLRLLAAGAVATALGLAAPGFVALACSVIGGNLGIALTGNGYQRDHRVFNNFLDASANDNQTPDPSFPGALGAVLSLWKAGRNWDSDTAGLKNFDFDFQGESSSAGNSNQNTHSGLQSGGSCGGGVLAFTETPISNGWRIRYCEQWTWQDGPNCQSVDLEGVGTHELGHALGLGHTGVGCGGACNSAPTMCPAICGTGCAQRSIEPDDQTCLQNIYGALPSNKPTITSLGGSTMVGGTLTINGTNFSTTAGANRVKFTAGTTTNVDPIPGVVTNVSSTGGGTQIQVTIPSTALDGNVLVWIPGASQLSNPFPIDIGLPPPGPPVIGSLSPGTIEAFQPPIVTINGSNLSSVTSITVGTKSPSFTIVDDSQITFLPPAPDFLGNNLVTATNPFGSDTDFLNYTATDPPRQSAPAVWGALSGLPLPVSWAGGASFAYIYGVSLDSLTIPFNGFNILVNIIPLSSGTLDSIGFGPSGFGIPMSAGLAGITLHHQVWEVNLPSGITSFEASAVTQSAIF